jgi:hypothetical protein
MDGIPELPGLWSLTPWGAILGILVFLTMAISRGWLIPKSIHERFVDQERVRGDEWKETALDQRAVNAEIRKQNGQLIESQQVVQAFLRAASPPFEETKEQGGKT